MKCPTQSGNFSVPVGINPYAAGQALICAYTHDGATVTLAIASLLLTVWPKESAGQRPASIEPPRITRAHGSLTCTSGQWSNGPTRYTYAWFTGGRLVGRGSRLAVSTALRGRTVRCRVTASNGAGSRTATSRPVLVR